MTESNDQGRQPKTLKEIGAEITEQVMNAFRQAAIEAEERKRQKQLNQS